MPKFFGIGKHTGEYRVSAPADTYAEAARAGLPYVVATDEELVDHVLETIAAATYPLQMLTVGFYGLVEVFPQIATAAQAKAPRAGLYPSNINPLAVRHWDNVFQMDKYKRAVSLKTPLQAWAIASKYFRDLCLNAGVHPYRDEMNPDFDLRDFVAERVRLVKSRLEQIYRHLDAGGVATKQTAWKWMKFESDASDFYVTASKTITCTARAKVKIDEILRTYESSHTKSGARKTADGHAPSGPVTEHMHYSVTDDSAVYLDYQPTQKRIIAELHIQIPRGMVLKTLRLAKPKTDSEEKRALKLLEALIQAWSHGELKAAVASFHIPSVSGPVYVADVLKRYLETEDAVQASAASFGTFYTSVLNSLTDYERLYFSSAMQADSSLMDQLHRFNIMRRRQHAVTAATTKQLRTLTELRVYKHDGLDVDPDDADRETVVLPTHAVLLPRVDEDAEDPAAKEFFSVLHPEKLHGVKITLTEEQRRRCADIENDTDTFEGSIAAAFEMLVEKFDSLLVLKSDTSVVIKSLGYLDTWPFAASRIWLHHLNMKSTHPGLTFDVVDAAGRKHLAALYHGVW